MNDFLMFRSMVSPWFIRASFGLSALFVTLCSIGLVLFGVMLFLGMGGAVASDQTLTMGEAGLGVGVSAFSLFFSLAPVVVTLILGLVWMRLMFEVSIILFQMNETLTKIAGSLEHGRAVDLPGRGPEVGPPHAGEAFAFGQS